MNYDYPGNIRELRSIIQAASNLAQKRPIGAKHLPDYLKGRKKTALRAPATADGPIVPWPRRSASTSSRPTRAPTTTSSRRQSCWESG